MFTTALKNLFCASSDLLWCVQLHSWHRQSVWMTRWSNLRFGTLRGKNDTTALHRCTTVALRLLSSCTTLQIRSVFNAVWLFCFGHWWALCGFSRLLQSFVSDVMFGNCRIISGFCLHLWNDLDCVGWGVKLYSLTHSLWFVAECHKKHIPFFGNSGLSVFLKF